MFLTEMAPPPPQDKKSLFGLKTEAGVSCDGSDEQAYNFRFVEVGEGTRATIRSHVMRDYYEKKDNRLRPSTVPELNSAASQKEGVLQQTHRFKVGPGGLQEVKAGRKKSKGSSRTKKAINVATNFSESEDSQVRTHSSTRAPRSNHPEPADFAHSDHWHQEQVPFHYGRWSAATSDKRIAIADALVPPQSEADSRNVTPPEKILSISGAIDPFNTLPTLCVPHTEYLLHHGKSSFSSIS